MDDLVCHKQETTHYARRYSMWTPEAVSTISLISPTLKPKAQFSNGFCIMPREKNPRSPPFFALFVSHGVTLPTYCNRSPSRPVS